MLAVIATRNVSTERCRPAMLDRTHDLHLIETDVTTVRSTPRVPVVAEDICNLQRSPGHDRRRLLWRFLLLAPEQRQLIERAGHIADDVACDLGVERRRLKLGVPQQNLNDTDINTLLHEMSCE
jgi:hypothetical protein